MSIALLTTLLAFTFGFVGSMPLAGPVALLLVSRSAEKKYGQAILVAFGAVCAEVPYAGLAFFGFSTFLPRHKWILPASHAVTAVLLVALGVYFARWTSSSEGKTKMKPERTGSFFLGLSIGALNPTLLATWSAVTAALYTHIQEGLEQWMAIPFGLAAGAGTISWQLILVLLLRHFGERFPHRVLTWAVRDMGSMLVVLGVVSGMYFIHYLLHGRQ